MSTDKDITKWASSDGHFKRQASVFRDCVSKDPNAKYPAEKGRYHLYVSYACPWAHRALLVRALKGLEDVISVSVVHPHMNKQGWSFNGVGYEGQGSDNGKVADVYPDTVNNFDLLQELYFHHEPDYSGRYTVPVVWDKKTSKIVNNESSEIVRFLYTEFDDLVSEDKKGVTYYPEKLRKEIDELNSWVYDTVNNGVYKSGFATTQEAYLENVKSLAGSLDRLNKMLEGKDYLIGDTLTEADIRLYPTIIRFDPVYVGHFKCNVGTIRHDYPNLNRWMKNLYWKNDAFKSTTQFDHIKIHYYTSHPQINPTRIVPYGPIPAIEPLDA